MGLLFFLFLASVAVLPQDKMGCFPVTQTVTVFLDWVSMCFKMGCIFQKLKHFWKYSVVTILCSGSIELT